MPLYEITTKDKEAKRLVEADSAAQAIRHCAEGMFQPRTVTKASDIARLMGAGVALEQASAEAKTPEQPPAGDDQGGGGTTGKGGK